MRIAVSITLILPAILLFAIGKICGLFWAYATPKSLRSNRTSLPPRYKHSLRPCLGNKRRSKTMSDAFSPMRLA
jgi:hypothetical protein